MYADFTATDRWSGKQVRCIYQALIVAIATRHADAIDIKFLVDGQPVWMVLPHPAWVEYQGRTGNTLNDPLAIQAAGHFLKQAIESGLYTGQEMISLSLEETLEHVFAVLEEAGAPVAR